MRGALPAVAGISLANKSQLLFGLAAAVILFLALAVPWIRSGLLIRAYEDEEARRIATAWLDGRVAIAEEDVASGPFSPTVNATDRVVDVTVVPLVAADAGPGSTPGAEPGEPGEPGEPTERREPVDPRETGPSDAAVGPSGPDVPTAAPGAGSGELPGTTAPGGTPRPVEDTGSAPDSMLSADPQGAAEAAGFVLEAAAAFRGDPDRPPVMRRYRIDDRTVVRVATPLTRRTLETVADRPPRLIFRTAPQSAGASAPGAARAASAAGELDSSAASDAPDGAGTQPGPEFSALVPGTGPDLVPAVDPRIPDIDQVVAMLIVDRDGGFAESSRLGTQIWILVAGIAGIAASIGAFWLILTRLILSPVRRLRETAEAVQAGDLSSRSEIRTGDEFEQLADAFNMMLDRLEQGRDELEQINRSLDLKVDELAKANVGLDESNRLKSEFVASVSHELRTPLNSIIGFAELLQELARSEDEADPKRIRYLDNIVGSGRSLLEMINELLDMAKIEAGRMEVSIEPTSVVDVVEGLVRIMGPQAEAKRVEVRTDVAGNLPTVETDPGKLQQILYNFLSNAVKFTPESGMITVGAERVLRHDRSIAVRLWVADSGPGIPADMQDMIFEKFRQADATHTREHAGTGLGLAICRSLAEMLGARVACTSRPGEGARFSVEVPAQWKPEEPPALMP